MTTATDNKTAQFVHYLELVVNQKVGQEAAAVVNLRQ